MLGRSRRAALDAAFAAHHDPLAGHEPEDDHRDLFRRIVENAPAPVGLGPAMGRAAWRPGCRPAQSGHGPSPPYTAGP